MITNVLKRMVFGLAAALAAMAAPAVAQEAAGDWVGVFEATPGVQVPLVVHLRRDDAGNLDGTMDIPTQGVAGVPLAEVAIDAGRLAFTVPAAGFSFRGQWDAAAKSWNGELSQGEMRWRLSFAALPAAPPLPADWQMPADGEIRQMIAERNAPRAGQGIVIGMLGPDGRRIVAGGPDPVADFDGRTLFEIGSITKVFTALILADMAQKGEISLDDPAGKYLPPGHRMPAHNERAITLRDLSTHYSGLPRIADDMWPISHSDDPFDGYTEEQLLAFLDRYRLQREPGSQWEYSNLGVGLLGYLLARAAGTDYEALLRDRITGPLGMDDTLVSLPPSHAARLAEPFDFYMRPARPTNPSVLMGAGDIRSTAEDMLKFAAAVLDPNSPIAPAVRSMLSVRAPTGNPTVEQALGWLVVHPEPGREILSHDGSTGGFRSALALEPAKGRAIVALANSAAEPSTPDIALHILIGSPAAPTPPVPPAPPAPVIRTEIALPAAALDKFVGRYDFADGFVIGITRVGRTLLAQREGIEEAIAAPIFPEGPLAFFWKAVDAQIRFVTDSNGAVTGAEFTQGALSLMGKRARP